VFDRVLFVCIVTGSHAGGTGAVAATVLPARRARADDTVPEDGHDSARRLPRVDPGRRGRRAGARGCVQSHRSGVGHHAVRDTRGTRAAVAGTSRVSDDRQTFLRV